MNKKVLMIAYHFPPCRGSSGIQRTLKFSRYLPNHDWQPIVLAPHPRAYPATGEDLLKEVHPEAVVYRSWALDFAKHLSIRGIYPSALALPDRWNSWALSAIPAGLRLIKKYEPDLIWSTYPIATAQLIALVLHKLSNIPWIADFRDPMLYETWPRRKIVRRAHGWLERKIVRESNRVVVTTPSTKNFYMQRYHNIPSTRWEIINNGYDEENFSDLPTDRVMDACGEKTLVLVHSGLMEPEDRDPTAFFHALERLREAGKIDKFRLKVILRATGDDATYKRQIEQNKLADTVFLESPVAYDEALAEMYNADGLLIFQGTTCNRQIPAKAYEYLRAQKPIFAMADPQGDTAKMLSACGVKSIVPLDDTNAIAEELVQFLDNLRSGKAAVANLASVRQYSREALTKDLVRVFNDVLHE